METILLKRLAGFIQHGVAFDETSTPEQARGTCPFCGRDEKFFANPETKCWDCKVCGATGNFLKFLELRHASYVGTFHGIACVRLKNDRKWNTIKGFRRFRLGWSPEMNWYAIPLFDQEGNVTDIQRYSLRDHIARSTTGRDFGTIQPDCKYGSRRVWVCEGAWDAIVLSDVFEELGIQEDIYGLPGAHGFHAKLGHIFDGKVVVGCFDHDNAGEQGAERFGKVFAGVAKSIEYIHWSPKLAPGYDLRDLRAANPVTADFWATLGGMLRTGLPGLEGKKTLAGTPGTRQIGAETVGASVAVGTPGDGNSNRVAPEQPDGDGLGHEEVITAYRKWLYMPDVEPIHILFGTLFANRFAGDPLWLFFVAPPGGAKSELIMPLTDAPLVYTTTSLTPHSLVSGASFGSGDPSLIPRLDGKVLAIKDFTTILTMNQLARDEIFGILRDAYDGRTDKQFGNGVVRRYISKFGIIAGVTPYVDAFAGSSVLGERFLKYRLPASSLVSGNRDTVMRALRNVSHEIEMRDTMASTCARCLDRRIDESDMPAIPETLLRRIAGLAEWISRLRAVVTRERYTERVQFKPSAEVPTRLSKQLLKLGIGMTVFTRQKEISEATYNTLAKTARDTAPDRVEMTVRALYLRRTDDYMTTNEVAAAVRFPVNTISFLLNDLDLLGLVRRRQGKTPGWVLSAPMMDLMEELNLYPQHERWVAGRKHAKATTVAAKKKVMSATCRIVSKRRST